MPREDAHSTDDNNRLQISPTEPLWTVNDVASYLRLQPETVRMMARAKKIPAIKVGKSWRFDPQIIQDWWMKSGKEKN